MTYNLHLEFLYINIWYTYKLELSGRHAGPIAAAEQTSIGKKRKISHEN